MYQQRILTKLPRHDRLFELIRQRNMVRKTGQNDRLDEQDMSEMHSFMRVAAHSLAPRVKVESPLKIKL